MDTQSNGLVLEGDFALTLQVISELPPAATLMRADHENEKFLRTSAIWHDPVDVEEMDAIGVELRRQDLKISLLMEMVSELLARQIPLPTAVRTRLTATGMSCNYARDDLPGAGKIAITLYIEPTFPKALQLYGELVESIEKDVVQIQFKGMSAMVQDQLEKLIFTQHRRSIAQRRQD